MLEHPLKEKSPHHGLLAPSARDRDKIVPQRIAAEPAGEEDQAGCPHRLAWAVLLARVLCVDVTRCGRCGGRMQIIAALTEPASIRRYLEGMDLPAQPPAIAAARPPPQPELELNAA